MSDEPLIKDIVTVDDVGRILIPKSMRREANIEKDMELHIQLQLNKTEKEWFITITPRTTPPVIPQPTE